MPGQGRIELFSSTKRLTASLVSGRYIAQTDQVASDNELVVDSIALSASPYVPCLCFLYLNDPIQQNFLIKSLDAGQDTFEGILVVPGGSCLSFVWAGDVGSSSLLYARLHYIQYQIVNMPTGKLG